MKKKEEEERKRKKKKRGRKEEEEEGKRREEEREGKVGCFYAGREKREGEGCGEEKVNKDGFRF